MKTLDMMMMMMMYFHAYGKEHQGSTTSHRTLVGGGLSHRVRIGFRDGGGGALATFSLSSSVAPVALAVAGALSFL